MWFTNNNHQNYKKVSLGREDRKKQVQRIIRKFEDIGVDLWTTKICQNDWKQWTDEYSQWKLCKGLFYKELGDITLWFQQDIATPHNLQHIAYNWWHDHMVTTYKKHVRTVLLLLATYTITLFVFRWHNDVERLKLYSYYRMPYHIQQSITLHGICFFIVLNWL